MHAERDYLVRFVFPRLREELLRWRIHFVDVDLRWGVTSDQALEVCREVVDECRPRFICLLGGRYGDVRTGNELSLTHEEVKYGVLDRLVDCPGDSFSSDAALRISVGPSDGLSAFGVGLNILH
jgi:hypothetical protein